VILEGIGPGGDLHIPLSGHPHLMGDMGDRSEGSEASSLASRDVNLEGIVLLGSLPRVIGWRIQLQRSTFNLE
jgi:hypothetical protein